VTPAEAKPFALEIVHQEPNYLLSTWGNVAITAWGTQGTAPLVARHAQCLAELARRYPEGFSSLHLIGKQAPLPTPEARAKLSEILEQYHATLACVGVVLEGSGFWASAIRSFILGLRLLGPRRVDLEVRSRIVDIAGWLPLPHRERTGRAIDARELENVLTQVRARAW
jgi:hypothetical protein